MEENINVSVETLSTPDIKLIKRRFKPLSFFSGLMYSIAALAILVLTVVMLAAAFSGESSQMVLLMAVLGGYILAVIAALFMAAVAVVLLVLGILQMVFAAGRNEKYQSRRPFFIAVLVIDVIMSLVLGGATLLLANINEASGEPIIVCLVSLGVIAISFIFCLVDLCIFNSRVKKGHIVIPKRDVRSAIISTVPATSQTATVEAEASSPATQINTVTYTDADGKAKQLEQLEKLYNSRTINREEYEKLKAEIA